MQKNDLILALCAVVLGFPWLIQAGNLDSYSAPANLGGTVSGTYTDSRGLVYDGSGYTVVVIDGAFLPRAPQLLQANGQSKVSAERCIGQETGTPWTSLCLDGQHSDHRLYLGESRNTPLYFYRSSSAGSSQPSNSALRVCRDTSSDAPDYFCHAFHGTATAALVAGTPALRNDPIMGGPIRYSGVAPGASLITIKVGGGVGDQAGWPIASVLDALNEVELLAQQPRSQPIVAVNISASGNATASQPNPDCSATSEGGKIDAIAARLKKKGIAVVMASGNDGLTAASNWTCGSHIIAVGATEVKQPTQATFYSNLSARLALLAPVGSGDYPCLYRNCLMTAWKDQGSFVVWGTSFASPQVAGAFAVLRQKYGMSESVDQLLSRLQNTGLPLSGPRATEAGPQAKVLNIRAALQ
ncbi:S8/S53 family peptidase [Neisseriaceae bacterium TC5R-5]|nr:S8/S53 family peptidase [Neisseriaceae bacterium TC5R-5]